MKSGVALHAYHSARPSSELPCNSTPWPFLFTAFDREVTVFNRHAYSGVRHDVVTRLSISFLGPLNGSRICYLFLVTVHWVICEQNLYVVIPLYVYDAMRELHFYANDGTLFSF